MVGIPKMRDEIESTFQPVGAKILQLLDGMDPKGRINLLRALLDYEMSRVRERIEELNALLPFEDRLQ